MGLKTYLFFIALLHMKQSHQDSCMLTSMCPATKELWHQRSKTFNCTERGTNYTCMLNKENRLVETCMYENVVGKEIVGCPFITTCKDSPQIAPENHYTDCPENIPGCPKWNHEPYTIFEMYKYPACFYSNKYEYAFLNIHPTTTNIFDKSQSSATPVGLIIGITIAITMALTVIIMIVGLVLIKRCLRRKREGSNMTGDEENMTFLGDDTQNATEEKQSTHSQPLIFGPEGPHFNEEEENITEIKDVTQNVTGEEQSTYSQPLSLSSGERFLGKMKQTLIEISKKAVQSISLSPIQKFCKLPVELLFAKVIINTYNTMDLSGKEMLYNRAEQSNEVRDPNDLFYKNGKPTRRIYMKGDAARGKTTYCLWLLHYWVKTQQRIGDTTEVDEWENALGKFDFVFLIRLRDVNKLRASVIDMICYDVLKIKDKEYIEWVRYVLKTGLYHCFIIIDGLDEWKPNHSIFQGLPITDDIANCVIFTTMRTWKFDSILEHMEADDRVVEILGLDKAGIKSTTENVLKNHYGLDTNKSTDKQKYDEVLDKTEKNNFGSIMEIPLLAVICVQILYKGEEVGKSLTRFYIELVGMLIKRADDEHDNDEIIATSETTGDHAQSTFSESLCKHPIVSTYISLLSKLGKLAYNGLLSGKHTFKFYADSLAKGLCITKEELEFSLKVGLLSREGVDSALTMEVKIYFFHKSVQEFLGAVYIASNEAARHSFFEYLSSTEVIIELDNVLIFLSGLDPVFGRNISQHICNVANRDAQICELRKYKSVYLLDLQRLKHVYEIQVSCYRECVYVQRNSDNRQQIAPHHVSDVCVSCYNDTETIRASADILDHHFADIKSLSLFEVQTDIENGIPHFVVTHFLSQTKALQSFYICGPRRYRIFDEIPDLFSSLTALHLIHVTLTPQAVKALQSALLTNTVIEALGLEFITSVTSLSGLLQALPKLPRLFSLRIQISHRDDKPVFLDMLSRLGHLRGIEYSQTLPEDSPYDSEVVQRLCKWTGLHWLYIAHINLSDKGLKLSPNMDVLKTILLDAVSMSTTEWQSFIEALKEIEHSVIVKLYAVTIDEESLSMLRSSAHFLLADDTVDDTGNHNIQLLTIWPLSSSKYAKNILSCLRTNDDL